MNISARNIFSGQVASLSLGPVSAEVEITTPGGDRLIATITRASSESLGLAVGVPVQAIVKASSVMLMTEASGLRLSARNCLAGTVSEVTLGQVSAEVRLTLAGGATVCASITREAVGALGLKAGVAATVVIKASSVLVGVQA